MNDKPVSNCPISQPLLSPDLEIVSFNGFAWSNTQGIMLQSTGPVVQNTINWIGNDN